MFASMASLFTAV